MINNGGSVWGQVALFGVLGLALAVTAPAYAGPIAIVNPSFETGDFTGWTQTGNTGFDGVTSGGAADGTFFAFFGPVGSPGGITQDVTTVAGLAYIVSFDLQTDGGVPSSVNAGFGTASYSVTNPSATGWTLVTIAGIAPTTTTALSFSFQDDPGFIFLDNVSVTAAPEPATLGLVGVSLAGLAWMKRSIFKKRA